MWYKDFIFYKHHLFILILTTASYKICNAQIIGQNACPNMTAMDEFNMMKFIGTWYENARVPNLMEIGAKCVSIEFSFLIADNVSNQDDAYLYPLALKSYVSRDILGFNINMTFDGRARKADDVNTEAQFFINFNEKEVPLWVLATDYDSFSLLYSCFQLLENYIHLENIWVYTRTAIVKDDVMDIITKALTAFNISTNLLSPTTQTGC